MPRVLFFQPGTLNVGYLHGVEHGCDLCRGPAAHIGTHRVEGCERLLKDRAGRKIVTQTSGGICAFGRCVRHCT
jgi:hypothetical protein